MDLKLNKAELMAILNMIDWSNQEDEMNAEALVSFVNKINKKIRTRDLILDEKVCDLLEELEV